MSHRVVLLHATPVAMSPIHTAFQEVWPEAELVNLLDDGLSTDRARESELSESMIARFVRFGHYGYDMKADGILITCSAFGPAIDQLASELPIPVLKPNEAMFHEAVAQGNNIGMLATFGPSVETMTDEFDSYVAEHGAKATLTTILVDDAIDLLKKAMPKAITGWSPRVPKSWRTAMSSCWRTFPPRAPLPPCGKTLRSRF